MDLIMIHNVLAGYPNLRKGIRIESIGDKFEIFFQKRSSEYDSDCDVSENFLYYNISNFSDDELVNLIEKYYTYLTFGEHEEVVEQFFKR